MHKYINANFPEATRQRVHLVTLNDLKHEAIGDYI